MTTQKITMRLKPCNCGCKGRDSQHAATMERVVADVQTLDAVRIVESKEFTTILVVALGIIRTAAGDRRVGFQVHHVDGYGWRPFGWRALAA